MLHDGRVWKLHLDHLRRDSIDSAVPQQEVEREFKGDAADPTPCTSGATDVPFPCQLPAVLPIGKTADSGDQPTLERLESSPPVESQSSEVGRTPLRRSIRVHKAPGRLIEKI